MAITFTDARSFVASNSAPILSGVTKASLFFWFRYENAGSQQGSVINNLLPLTRQYQTGMYTALWADTSAGYVDLVCDWLSSGGQAQQKLKLAVGTAYPILMVFDQGSQAVYLPGQSLLAGTRTGTLTSDNHKIALGGTPPGSPCVYTLGDVNIWVGYALTQDDYNSLVLGGDPTAIGGGATARYRWTLAGTVGTAAAANDAGLTDAYVGAVKFDSVSGSGTAVYSLAMSYQPSVTLSSQSRVGTSGQTIFLWFETISGGALTQAISVATAPTIAVNGVKVGALTAQLLDSTRPFLYYQTPAGVTIQPGDTVTLTAPALWATTQAGAAAELSDWTITNKSGVSAFGTESLAKTLRLGVGFVEKGPTIWGTYWLQRNLRRNLCLFSGATRAADGTPLSFPGSSATAGLYNPNNVVNNNDLDATGIPALTGLFAIGWDSPLASNTRFAITTWSGGTTITERTDLANPGDATGNGRVRVFDCQRSATNTGVGINLQVTCTQADGHPNFANLDIRGPGDFSYTDGQPVVLDQNDAFALSAMVLDRLHNGLGMARYLESTIGFSAASKMVEPWHLRNLNDFTWNPDALTYSWNSATYTQARPFIPSGSTYFYGPPHVFPAGSPFTATLATSIDSQTTTLTISDAATAPVLVGLMLSIDSELMSVRAVDSTTVTVFRGAANTTPAAHNAGTIQVLNRLKIDSLAEIGSSKDQIFEVVCSAPHGLITGMPQIVLNGTWPAMTFTDGSLANPTNSTTQFMVTGATTFVTAFDWLATISDGPVTLAKTYDLSGGNTYSWGLPDGGYPYEFTAKVTSRFEDCYHYVNLPFGASDSLVYEVARRTMANLTTGRTILVELCDEPWNFGFPSFRPLRWLDRLNYPSGPTWSWLAKRTGQLTQIFLNVQASTGWTGTIIGVLGSQGANAGVTTALLGAAQAQGVTQPLGIATACYLDPDNNASSVAAYNAATIEQAIDLFIHDIYYCTTSLTTRMAGHMAAIASFNAATGQNAQMFAYEGGFEVSVPGSSSNKLQRSRDMAYSPNWYIAEKDFYAWMQQVGYTRIALMGYSIYYPMGGGANNWGLYHWQGQPYGRGDGSDGKADNRLCMATPGLPNTKTATTNQDTTNVSVRGQAFLDWMKEATAMANTTTTTTVGRCKGAYKVQSRCKITKPDLQAGGGTPTDLSTLAAKSVDTGLNPYIDFWGSSDTRQSTITFAFALFDETNSLMGLTDACSLTASSCTSVPGQFLGDRPGHLDIGSARFVACIILAVSGTWTLYWRPYGQYKFPC